MKKLALASCIALVSAMVSHGAVTFSGTAATNLQNNAGDGTVADGTLWLLVASSDSSFGATSTNSVNAGNINVGDTFGDANDVIFARGVTSSGGFPPASAKAQVDLSNFEATSFLNQAFALVWFSTLTNAATAVANNDTYGILTPANWDFPGSNTGSFAFGSEFTSVDGSGTASDLVVGIPEPSRAVLAGLGLMGLFFRRRR
jgi:hypothetical protein